MASLNKDQQNVKNEQAGQQYKEVHPGSVGKVH